MLNFKQKYNYWKNSKQSIEKNQLRRSKFIRRWLTPGVEWGVYNIHDEVKPEKDLIPPPMNQKSDRQITESCRLTESEIVQYAEENSHSNFPRLSNRRDADEGQIAMIYSEELQQDMQSRNINMKMNREHSVRLKQRVKEFRSRIEEDQTERGKGFHGKICKLLP